MPDKVVDASALAVIAFAEAGADAVIDQIDGHRLHAPTLVVFDTFFEKEIGTAEIDGDTDDVFYDVKRNRVYVSCGVGFLDVIDAGQLKMLEKIPTATGARTSLFVPEYDRLCVAVPHRGNQPAEVRVYEVDHP